MKNALEGNRWLLWLGLQRQTVDARERARDVLGAMLGYCLGTMSPAMLTLSLSFASGAMLYVVFGELLPEALDLWHSQAPAFAAVLGMLLGMLLIYA